MPSTAYTSDTFTNPRTGLSRSVPDLSNADTYTELTDPHTEPQTHDGTISARTNTANTIDTHTTTATDFSAGRTANNTIPTGFVMTWTGKRHYYSVKNRTVVSVHFNPSSTHGRHMASRIRASKGGPGARDTDTGTGVTKKAYEKERERALKLEQTFGHMANESTYVRSGAFDETHTTRANASTNGLTAAASSLLAPGASTGGPASTSYPEYAHILYSPSEYSLFQRDTAVLGDLTDGGKSEGDKSVLSRTGAEVHAERGPWRPWGEIARQKIRELRASQAASGSGAGA